MKGINYVELRVEVLNSDLSPSMTEHKIETLIGKAFGRKAVVSVEVVAHTGLCRVSWCDAPFEAGWHDEGLDLTVTVRPLPEVHLADDGKDERPEIDAPQISFDDPPLGIGP